MENSLAAWRRLAVETAAEGLLLGQANMKVRIRRIVSATLCAAALVLTGIAVWDCRSAIRELAPAIGHSPTDVDLSIVLGALLVFGSGQFLFLHAVADELCPEAPSEVRWFAKTLALEACCVAVAGILHQCWALI